MPATRTKDGFYGVHKGRKVGVFTTWADCEEQVTGYPGAKFKKFPTRDEAKVFMEFGHLRTSMTVPPSNLPSGSKPTRLEIIKAALSQPSPPPESQPSTPSLPSGTKPTRLEIIKAALSQPPPPPESQPSIQRINAPRPTPSSSTRFEQIYLALTTPPSTDTLDCPSTSSQALTESSAYESSLPTPSVSQVSPPSPVSQPRVIKRFLDIKKLPDTKKSLDPAPTPPMSLPQFTDDGPLSQYFSEYCPSFTPDLSNPPTKEFDRMTGTMWLPYGRHETHKAFKDALSQEFNVVYGTDINSLDSWQALCTRIGISPIPETLEECREVVMDTHVNLVDLVTPSGAITIFQSVEDLSRYSIKNGKIFPRDNIHDGDLLRYLRRHIFNPALDADRSARNRRFER